MTNSNHRTMIGGQAVIEGVMMRGPKNAAMSVRTPTGEITTESWPTMSVRDRHHILGLPFVRGIIAFAESLVFGIKCLNRSGEIAGVEDEPSPTNGAANFRTESMPDEKAAEQTGAPGSDDSESSETMPGGRAGAAGESEAGNPAVSEKKTVLSNPQSPTNGAVSAPDGDGAKAGASEKLMMAGAMVLGIVIAIALFMVLPTTVVSLLKGPMRTAGFGAPWLFTLIEGLIRIGIFLGYLAAISCMKDIQRVFEYHGAEHKSIYCYEHGEELTVENARKYTRLHPRCGTSFLLIVFIVSILVYSFVTWSNPVERVAIHLLLLPLVVGISFEIIHFAGLHDNSFMRFILGPGLWLQKLTTREPDDSQLEVALTSLKAVLTGNREDDKW